MGPSAIRYAGLSARLKALGYQVYDEGNLHVPVRDSLSCEECDELTEAIQRVCQAAYDAAEKCVRMGETPLFLGGDHSLSIGTIGGVTAQDSVGVLWIDAHAMPTRRKVPPPAIFMVCR